MIHYADYVEQWLLVHFGVHRNFLTEVENLVRLKNNVKFVLSFCIKKAK